MNSIILSVMIRDKITSFSAVSNRHFSISCPSFLRLDHPLVHYVDWAQVGSGMFAIVDPSDPGSLLYVSNKEYKDLLKTAISNETTLTVVARPYEHQPDARDIPASNPKPSKTPPQRHYTALAGVRKYYSRFRKQFLWMVRSEGAVVPTQGNLSGLIGNWGKTLAIWCGFPPASKGLGLDILETVSKLRKVLLHGGPLGLVLYLKVSYISIQKYLLGTPLSSTFDLGTRVTLSRNGLPKWLPVSARKAIALRHAPTIRLWSSILYIYRSFKTPDLKRTVDKQLRGITSPPLEDQGLLLGEFRSFLSRIFIPRLGGIRRIPTGDPSQLGTFFKAGPNGRPALVSRAIDAVEWFQEKNTELRNQLMTVLVYHGLNTMHGYHELIDLGHHPDAISLHATKLLKYLRGEKGGFRPPSLSRLHALYENAGKVRIIAIVDYYTQYALKPLHDDLFEVLKKISADGTFDQGNLFTRIKRVQAENPDMIWSSLDISSATDMIPKELYQILLEELYKYSAVEGLTEQYVGAVIDLMTARDFLVPQESSSARKRSASGRSCHSGETVRYTRGQPMGALASFALLGLIHHAIIQFSAYRSGKLAIGPAHLDKSAKVGLTPVIYGVTGDDSVFGERPHPITGVGAVSQEYLAICDALGIPIKLIKSFPDCKGVSFLSRWMAGGVEYSPVSFKDELGVTSFTSRGGLISKMIERGWLSDVGNPSGRLVRMMVTHWEYLDTVIIFQKINRISLLVQRAFLTLLTPQSPLRSALIVNGLVDGKRLLDVWLALLEGGYPRLVRSALGTLTDFTPKVYVGDRRVALLSQLFLVLHKQQVKITNRDRIRVKVGYRSFMNSQTPFFRDFLYRDLISVLPTAEERCPWPSIEEMGVFFPSAPVALQVKISMHKSVPLAHLEKACLVMIDYLVNSYHYPDLSNGTWMFKEESLPRLATRFSESGFEAVVQALIEVTAFDAPEYEDPVAVERQILLNLSPEAEDPTPRGGPDTPDRREGN